jgi:hypothetical protein
MTGGEQGGEVDDVVARKIRNVMAEYGRSIPDLLMDQPTYNQWLSLCLETHRSFVALDGVVNFQC